MEIIKKAYLLILFLLLKIFVKLHVIEVYNNVPQFFNLHSLRHVYAQKHLNLKFIQNILSNAHINIVTYSY